MKHQNNIGTMLSNLGISCKRCCAIVSFGLMIFLNSDATEMTKSGRGSDTQHCEAYRGFLLSDEILLGNYHPCCSILRTTLAIGRLAELCWR